MINQLSFILNTKFCKHAIKCKKKPIPFLLIPFYIGKETNKQSQQLFISLPHNHDWFILRSYLHYSTFTTNESLFIRLIVFYPFMKKKTVNNKLVFSTIPWKKKLQNTTNNKINWNVNTMHFFSFSLLIINNAHTHTHEQTNKQNASIC